MSTLTLTPKLQITNPPPAPIPRRRSLVGALVGKLAEWIEASSPAEILRGATRLLLVVSLALFIFAQNFFLGWLTAVLQWNGYKVPIFVASLTLILNAKRIWGWVSKKRTKMKLKTGNQHTVYGIAVSDLTDYLLENQSFKKEEAEKKLALTHGQWYKIADALEKYGMLCRGEANARVLRPIERERLVMNLRALAEKKAPPFVWDETRNDWYERDGSFHQFVLAPEWRQKKREEEIARKERKVARIEKKLSEATAFQQVLNMAAR